MSARVVHLATWKQGRAVREILEAAGCDTPGQLFARADAAAKVARALESLSRELEDALGCAVVAELPPRQPRAKRWTRCESTTIAPLTQTRQRCSRRQGHPGACRWVWS